MKVLTNQSTSLWREFKESGLPLGASVHTGLSRDEALAPKQNSKQPAKDLPELHKWESLPKSCISGVLSPSLHTSNAGDSFVSTASQNELDSSLSPGADNRN